MSLQRPITYLHHHLQEQTGSASLLQCGEKRCGSDNWPHPANQKFMQFNWGNSLSSSSELAGGNNDAKVKVLVVQSWLTLCDPVDCSRLGSSVHGTLQARILEWVALPFSRGSPAWQLDSLPSEPPGKPWCWDEEKILVEHPNATVCFLCVILHNFHNSRRKPRFGEVQQLS